MSTVSETLHDVELRLPTTGNSNYKPEVIQALMEMDNYNYSLVYDLIADNDLSIERIFFDNVADKWFIPLTNNIDEYRLISRLRHDTPLIDLLAASINKVDGRKRMVVYNNGESCELDNGFSITSEERNTVCFNKPAYFLEYLIDYSQIDQCAADYGYSGFMLLFYRVMWLKLSALLISKISDKSLTVTGIRKFLVDYKHISCSTNLPLDESLSKFMRVVIRHICKMQEGKKGKVIGGQLMDTTSIHTYLGQVLDLCKAYSLEAGFYRLNINYNV